MKKNEKLPEFVGFPKIARLSRDIVISEKIDGTNAQIFITKNGRMFVGSKKKYLSEGNDNAGFWKWTQEHKEELLTLGPGRHFGEWWGQGIQRRYGLDEKRFSLFNTGRWNAGNVPDCCHVVPVMYEGLFEMVHIYSALQLLINCGSVAAPGFLDPEGIVIFHTALNGYFKKTIKGDEKPKGSTE